MKNRIILFIIAISIINISNIFAQGFRTPSLTGNVASDFNAAEKVTVSWGLVYAMTWDANNLYLGVTGPGAFAKDEPTIAYFDTDPLLTPTLGTGSLAGYNNYDGRTGTLPFTGNVVVYYKSNYAEIRTNTTGTWSTSTPLSSSIVTGTNDLEITIPWTNFPGGVRPLSMRELFFKENGNAGTDAYGIMPGELNISNVNTTPFSATTFYTSWDTKAAAMTHTMTATNCEPPVLSANTPLILDFNDYRGAGFSLTPLASIGQLCANTWATTGWSDGAKAFGAVNTAGDHGRGVRTAAVTTGGFYGIQKSATDYGFLIQPGGSDFAPGTLTLKVQNKTGAALSTVNISYDVLEFNDQPRANSLNCLISADNVTYTPISALDYTTTAAAAAVPSLQTTPKSSNVGGFSVPNNGFFYVRWSSADVSGTGSRDELGFDNLKIQACGFTNIVASSPSCSCGNATSNVTFTAYTPNSGTFKVINAATNAVLATGTSSPISISLPSSSASVVNIQLVDNVDPNCISAPIALNLPACGVIPPTVSATTVASITGAATGKYSIIVSNINGGDCAPYNVTVNGVTQVFSGAPLTFGPFNHSSIGGPGGYNVIIDDADADALADLTQFVAESFSTGVDAQQNSAFCDCTGNPPGLMGNSPAGKIMAQSQSGTFVAGGATGKIQKYLLVDAAGNIVSSNPSGLHTMLVNGNYKAYAINYLAADAATIDPKLAVGQPLSALTAPTAPLTSLCYNLAGPASYTISCNLVPTLSNLTPTVCTNVTIVNLSNYESQMGATGGVWVDNTNTTVAAPSTALVTKNPFRYTINGTSACNSSAILSLSISPLPSAPSAIPDITVCQGSPATVVVPNAGTPVVTAAQAIWKFDGNINAGSSTSTNLSTGSASIGAGVVGGTYVSGCGAAMGAIPNVAYTGTDWVATTMATAVSSNDYFEFIVSTPVDYSFDITSLKIDMQRSATGPVNYAVVIDGVNVGMGMAIPTACGTQTISGFTRPVTFNSTSKIRVYAWGSTNPAGTLRVDNVTVLGNSKSFPSTSYNFYSANPTPGPATLLAGNTSSYTVTATNTDQTIYVTSVNGSGCESAAITAKIIAIIPPADPTLACGDKIDVTLGTSCSFVIPPSMVLSNATFCGIDAFKVEIMNGTQSLGNTANASMIGKNYTIKATSPKGNFCWGNLIVEDKIAPVFTNCPGTINKFCEDIPSLQINTTDATKLASGVLAISGNISASDCSPYTMTYSDEVQTFPCGNPLAMVISRTFKAIDNFGNAASCVVTFNVARRTLADVSFPSNKVLNCAAYKNIAITPAIAGAPYVGGTSTNTISPNSICDFVAAYTDSKVNTCGGGAKITREWIIIDCSGAIKKGVQIIDLTDLQAPTMVCPTSTITASVNGQNCDFVDFKPTLLTATDDCDPNPLVTYYLLDAGGTKIGTPKSLAIGTYTIIYVATDACGMRTLCPQTLLVADKAAPVAICDQNTKVSLSSDGTALIQAEKINDNSNDNCCLDVNRFEIKRASDSDAAYAKNMLVNCGDKNIMVALRVWDCYNNANVCMANVVVEDKLPPVAFGRDTIVCCGTTPSATTWLNNSPLKLKTLIDYPTATNPGYFDNCLATPSYKQSGVIDNCGNGTVTHTWTVTDASGLTTSTSVNYISENRSAYTVTFPADITLTCNNNKQYASNPSSAGTPEIKGLGFTCPLVGVEYKDDILKIVPDACFQIVRTWKILNWCQPLSGVLNPNRGDVRKTGSACSIQDRTFTNIYEKRPNGSSVYAITAPCHGMMESIRDAEGCYNYDTDGYMEYVQVIKVIDLTPPTLVAGKVKLDPVGKECKVKLTVEKPTSTDCTGATIDSYEVVNTANNTALYSGKTFPAELFFNENQFGNYVVRYTTTDQCGNYNSTDVAIKVKDVKKPTPICHNSISVNLMATKMVMVNASVFDAGSYDNCTPQNKLKLKIQVPAPNPADVPTINPDTMKTFYTFTCPPVGTVPNPNNPNAYFITVALWVGDEAGNWDYCETIVDVQDNLDICGYNPIQMKPVNGEIMTEKSKEVESVMVKLDGFKKNQMLTTAQGKYKFADLPILGNYMITPEKDNFHVNGVSTLDLVLISKHILGIQQLSSPYQMIAADVNKNGTISTADMVELRKLVLGIQTNFNKNTSWRFIDKAYVFPEPTNPWKEVFPESKEFKGLLSNSQGDFVAVKIGDINGNADPSANAAPRGVNENKSMNIDEQSFEADQIVSVKIDAAELGNILGYQTTMAFDKNVLTLEDVQGDANNFAMPETGFVTISHMSSTLTQSYTLIFKAKHKGLLSQVLTMNSHYTASEVYNEKGETFNLNLNIKGKINEKLELYQNRPNPFNDATVLSFSLPTNQTARIVITDVSGRTVKVIEKEFAKGYNEIAINKSELGNSGIFYYRLETSNQNLTNKMILID